MSCKAILVIMACLLVAAKTDQNLDCRKLVYSRNCRGVAIKRGQMGNGDPQPGIVLDPVSLNGLLGSMNPATEASSSQDASSTKRSDSLEEQFGDEYHREKIHLSKLLYALLFGNRRRNTETDNPLSYDY